jgi:hypothetical protein
MASNRRNVLGNLNLRICRKRYNAVVAQQNLSLGTGNRNVQPIELKARRVYPYQWRIALIAACLWAAFGLFAGGVAAQSDPPDPPAANPARPTVATPATLTPVGYLQFETGVQGAWHSPEFSSRFGLNEVIKLAVASRLQVFVIDEPWAHFRSDGQPGNGAGGLAFGAQAMFRKGEGASPTLAVSYAHSVYDGTTPDLDFGSPTNSVILLASADVKGFHYDANVMFNELTLGSVSRLQFGQTLSVSHPLKGPFNITGEIWHFPQPFSRGRAVGTLWSLGYAPRKNLVFDAGFNRGLTGTSTRWEVFAGFTYLLPHRLF